MTETPKRLFCQNQLTNNGKAMSEKRHLLDWYIENTPSDEKEYDKGCLFAFSTIAIVFITLVILILKTQ